MGGALSDWFAPCRLIALLRYACWQIHGFHLRCLQPGIGRLVLPFPINVVVAAFPGPDVAALRACVSLCSWGLCPVLHDIPQLDGGRCLQCLDAFSASCLLSLSRLVGYSRGFVPEVPETPVGRMLSRLSA